MQEQRLHFPATARNREPILSALARSLPAEGLILELGSGSGEHAAYFAPRLRPRVWQPTDCDPRYLASIAAFADAGVDGAPRPPVALDAAWTVWPFTNVAGVVAINVIHIAPWAVCEAILAGAGRVLRPGGVLFLYGPFRRDDVPTAPSNERFDQSLRTQNPAWGLRHLGEVAARAAAAGLKKCAVYELPANNIAVDFVRRD